MIKIGHALNVLRYLDPQTFHPGSDGFLLKSLGVDVINEDRCILTWLHLPVMSVEGLSDQLKSYIEGDQPPVLTCNSRCLVGARRCNCLRLNGCS